MSKVKRDKLRAKKKLNRRKKYVKHRNRMKGRKPKLKHINNQAVDGAEFYKQLKEKEAQEKLKDETKPKKKENVFKKFFKNFKRGDR